MKKLFTLLCFCSVGCMAITVKKLPDGSTQIGFVPSEQSEVIVTPAPSPTQIVAQATPIPTLETEEVINEPQKCNFTFNGRKDPVDLLVLKSSTQSMWKILTNSGCSPYETVKGCNGDKCISYKFCGIANENRAHYCSSAVKVMPERLVIGNEAVQVPKKCRNKTRCE